MGLALKLNADGVHIGQDDESAASVRERIGKRILGVSAHTIEEARRAILHGADYIGVGPIYPTVSKEDAKPVQGRDFCGPCAQPESICRSLGSAG